MDRSSFAEVLKYNAEVNPDGVAYRFIHPGNEISEKITNAQLFSSIASIAESLRSNLEHGTRVVIVISSGLEFICAFYACLFSGLVAVPAYLPRTGARWTAFRNMVEDCNAEAIVTTEQFSRKISKLYSDDKSVTKVPETLLIESLLLSSGSEPVNRNWIISGEDLAFLQYTSGTTGSPKGVQISHSNLLHNEETLKLSSEIDECSVIASWLPVFHDMGLVFGVMLPTYCGLPGILMAPMTFLKEPITWLRAISQYKVTTSGGPNFSYDLCNKRISDNDIKQLDLSSWRCAFSGAEMVRASTMREFHAKFSVAKFSYNAFYPCYGMAETTLVASGGRISAPPVIEKLSVKEKEYRRASVVATEEGVERKVVPTTNNYLGNVVETVGVGFERGCHIKVVDPSNQYELKDGVIGEIWIRGKSVSRGYWEKPYINKKRFQAKLSHDNKTNYFRTGDFGYTRNDELFITGRIKEMLIIRGKNYFPTDIEQILHDAHTVFKLNKCAAFAVDDMKGESLVVVQEVKISDLRIITLSDLEIEARFILQRDFGLELREIVFIRSGTLPTTTSGKVKRGETKTNYQDGRLKVIIDIKTKDIA